MLLASRGGQDEDVEASWRVADLLGRKGVPSRLDDWGEEWDHDAPTWLEMLCRYADEPVA